MRFSLYVRAKPKTDEKSDALKFAEALLLQGHSLYRVFFYAEAVLSVAVQSESKAWHSLVKSSGADLCLCSASATRHGVLRRDHSGSAALDPFSVGGLAQLVDAHAHSDRLISFQ